MRRLPPIPKGLFADSGDQSRPGVFLDWRQPPVEIFAHRIVDLLAQLHIIRSASHVVRHLEKFRKAAQIGDLSAYPEITHQVYATVRILYFGETAHHVLGIALI